MYQTAVDRGHEGFDNDRPDAPEQLRLLGDILNEHTFAELEKVDVQDGWHCWDIGTGDGAVAHWLAERVGATGSVLATDLKPDHVPEHPRLTAAHHDIVAEPLPERRFDLIHARLVLMHLAEREEIARRLAAHVRPGGVLVLTDWYCDCTAVVTVPAEDHVEALCWDYHDAVHDLAKRSDMDLGWAARIEDVVRDAGHTDVSTTVFRASGQGGGPSALLARLHTFMLEPHLVTNGRLNQQDLATIRAALLDPTFEMATYHAYTTVLRVPARETR